LRAGRYRLGAPGIEAPECRPQGQDTVNFATFPASRCNSFNRMRVSTPTQIGRPSSPQSLYRERNPDRLFSGVSGSVHDDGQTPPPGRSGQNKINPALLYPGSEGGFLRPLSIPAGSGRGTWPALPSRRIADGRHRDGTTGGCRQRDPPRSSMYCESRDHRRNGGIVR